VGEDPIADTDFARGLLEPIMWSSCPAVPRPRGGRVNPGAQFIRIALVAGMEECLEATRRIREFAQQL
jgi:N-succinyldiaminopimelate aminotransferase